MQSQRSGELSRLSALEELYSWVGDPVGTQTSKYSLASANERSKHVWADVSGVDGQDRPPLETYTTTPTAHGDVVRATSEYVRWFQRTYPAAGPEDRARVSPPGPSPQRYGGGEELKF